MRTPHDRYPRFFKNRGNHLYFFTKSLTFPVAAAADPQMNCVRMYFQNPLDFFIKSFILPGKMPAPAALHKGGHLQFFISIFTKTMSPPIQCRKTSCAGADGLRTGAGQHNNPFVFISISSFHEIKSPFLLSLLHSTVPFAIIWKAWGYSSAGRAFEWHSKGQRFDPAYLHHAFNPPHLSDVVLFIHSPHRSK